MANLLAERYQEKINAILSQYPDKRSAVLPVMYLAQEVHGFMNHTAMVEVAELLDLETTHVKSIAGFYTLFYEEKVGKHVLEICNDLPCALRGADQFVEMACKKLDAPLEGTSADGLFTVKAVMCLAACDKAPMMQVDLNYEENLDEEKFDAIIARLRAAAKKEA